MDNANQPAFSWKDLMFPNEQLFLGVEILS
jgi:hypothetical protein